MKDEIKEILDYISSRTVDDCLLDDYFSQLKDYITNLQEKYDKEKISKKKAIEYIKNKQELNKMFGTITLSKDSQNKLLNILGGDNNE